MRKPPIRCTLLPGALLLLLLAAGIATKRDDQSPGRPVSILKGPDSQTTGQTSESSAGQDPPVGISLPVKTSNASSLLGALDRSTAIEFTAPGFAPLQLLLAKSDLLAPGFQLTRGPNRASQLEGRVAVYSGKAVRTDSFEEPATATLVVAGDALHLEIHTATADQVLTVRGSLNGPLEAILRVGEKHEGATCRLDLHAGVASFQEPESLGEDEPDESAIPGVPANLAPSPGATSVMALSGTDPATGKADKFVDPIPLGTAYRQSLKDALLLLVLDKEATGPNTDASLFARASQEIARIANVAAVYENQLGIRLLLQELIMIPSQQVFVGIPSTDALGDFSDWCQKHRPQRRFRWSMAVKKGAGLPGRTLGLANVRQIHKENAVSIVKPNADYSVIAHEAGHNLGAGHTTGGLMSGRATADHGRNFFTDLIGKDGVTAAKDIQAYAQGRLPGPATMRDATELPFARSDAIRTRIGTPVTIDVLANDLDHVRHGKKNTRLTVIETGQIVPAGSGEASIVNHGEAIVFTPSPGFMGTAWFSYTLRGNVGNDDQGWLHKGDVAVRVEVDDNQPLVLNLRPGASYSFIPPGGIGNLTQPQQAHAIRSDDVRNLIVLRIQATASGRDRFRVGGQTYTIFYSQVLPEAFPDSVWIDEFQESIWIAPLANDRGSGYPWLHQIDPNIGIGTDDDRFANPGRFFFPTSLFLVKAENNHPDLGELEIERHFVTVGGVREQAPTGRLKFTPSEGATGTALIPYEFRDGTGLSGEGVISVEVGTGYDTLIGPNSAASVAIPTDTNWRRFDNWLEPDFEPGEEWSTGEAGSRLRNQVGLPAVDWNRPSTGTVWNRQRSLCPRSIRGDTQMQPTPRSVCAPGLTMDSSPI